MDRRRRTAFTLVELLVAVAVAAVLIGLLLGAVQKVRDRAAALSVANSAKQVVLAAHTYSSAHGGRLPNVDGDEPNWGRGMFRALGPTLGQPDGQLPSPLLRLRSDPTWQETFRFDPGGRQPPEVRPDYAVSFGANALLFRVGARLDAVAADGLSQTVAAATHYSRCRMMVYSPSLLDGDCSDERGMRVPCDTLPLPNPTDRRATFADAMHFDVRPVTRVTNGVPVTTGSESHTFQHRPPPAECYQRVPQSLTAGGLTVGMADGSVRTVRPDVSQAVFWGAVTPSGGEVLAWDD